jgi:two-component system KDP operon response regulator KdpE
MKQKILVIEDDKDIAYLLCWKLEEEGFEVLTACDGVQGLEILKRQHPNLVLLDLMLPRVSGWELCQQIRESSDVPIIMLTALARVEDKVRGLELGADDYLTKPFRRSELVARIQAVLRRSQNPLHGELTVQIDDRLLLDRAGCRVIVDGHTVDLSPIEYKILDCFVTNQGRVLTHQSLLTRIWGWEYADDKDYLKVYVYHLRRKIERNPRKPDYILTERGLGYRFQAS